MSVFLKPHEIVELTGRQHTDAQRRVLDEIKVTYAQRPNGSLIVLRAHVESLLGAKPAIMFAHREPQLAP